MAPPTNTVLDGQPVDLRPLAESAARRHLTRHPDDVEVYGAQLAYDWAFHDLSHVLSWAFAEHAGLDDLSRQMRWLADLLAAREYDVGNLADSLQECAAVVREAHPSAEPVAARLEVVAEEIRPTS
jgi:hypothetical protein